MIERISIENYKSIRELKDFELKPINVLIGANGSGKSNFLDVFAFLRDTLNDKTSQNNSPGYLFSALQKRGEKESICFFDSDAFQISTKISTFDYSVKIGWQPPPYQHSFYIVDEKLRNTTTNQEFLKQKNKIVNVICEDGDREVTENVKGGLAAILDNRKYVAPSVFEFVTKLANIRVYDRINSAPGSPVRIPQKPKGDRILEEDAGNLVDVLHQMVQTSEVFKRQLAIVLKILFPDFKRISFPHNEKGELFIRWENAYGQAFNTPQLSDGMLKFLCMVAILKNPHLPPLIGIDEPDAKLHPRMQEIFADMIREASEKSQIIITTHNPDFVTFFEPEDILILVLHKGETEIRRFSDKGALELWLEDFNTRELWLMGELESRW